MDCAPVSLNMPSVETTGEEEFPFPNMPSEEGKPPYGKATTSDVPQMVTIHVREALPENTVVNTSEFGEEKTSTELDDVKIICVKEAAPENRIKNDEPSFSLQEHRDYLKAYRKAMKCGWSPDLSTIESCSFDELYEELKTPSCSITSITIFEEVDDWVPQVEDRRRRRLHPINWLRKKLRRCSTQKYNLFCCFPCCSATE